MLNSLVRFFKDDYKMARCPLTIRQKSNFTRLKIQVRHCFVVSEIRIYDSGKIHFAVSKIRIYDLGKTQFEVSEIMIYVSYLNHRS